MTRRYIAEQLLLCRRIRRLGGNVDWAIFLWLLMARMPSLCAPRAELG